MNKPPVSNSKRLRIGVTYDYDLTRGFFLKEDVLGRLSHLGAQVIPLLDKKTLALQLQDVDGVLLPGGLGDLDPAAYGQTKKYEEVKITPERPELEYQVLDLYLPQDRPLLGICWGHQLLNVYFGGTLYQDIRRDIRSMLNHEQTEPHDRPTHSVLFEASGQAQNIFKTSELQVNSTHHQAIDCLANCLIAEGRSPDTLIECFRHKTHRFLWGVQWHPERLQNDLMIEAFLKACRN